MTDMLSAYCNLAPPITALYTTIMINEPPIPVIVIDDTPIKRRGVCDFVEETTRLQLSAQAGDMAGAITLVESICQHQSENAQLQNWLILSDLHLGNENGIELGRALLEIASGLRVVIYTQDPSWTLAAEIFRQEYTRRGVPRGNIKGSNKQPGQQGLHGYALFTNIEPSYLDAIASTVVRRHETFIDPEVLNYLLKKLRGQLLTPRQEECAVLIAKGLSNDDIALHMGFLHPKGGPNMGPLENIVSELYNFFAIDGAPSDPGRRVLLALAYEAYAGLRPE
jgi:DNA-binding NarL/FixJ family response regulator